MGATRLSSLAGASLAGFIKKEIFMTTKPDTIKVSANHKEEIRANRAELFVTVKGSSLVSRDAAMKKAKEVNQLVEALRFGD